MRLHTLALATTCFATTSFATAPAAGTAANATANTTAANLAPVEKTFDSVGIKKVEIENLSGTITITGSEGAKQTVVKVTKNDFGEHCKLEIEREGSELEISIERRGMSVKACHADVAVTTHRPVGLELSSGSGTIDVKGTKGPVTFSVGSGDVAIAGDVERIDGRSGSGAVRIEGLTGGGKLKTGSGAIVARYLTVPARGSLDLRSGSGAAEVSLPAGAKLRSSLASGSGTLTNELGDSSDATFVVQMKSGSGGLTIKKNQ